MSETVLFSNDVNIQDFNETALFIELRDGYLVGLTLYYFVYLKTIFLNSVVFLYILRIRPLNCQSQKLIRFNSLTRNFA